MPRTDDVRRIASRIVGGLSTPEARDLLRALVRRGEEEAIAQLLVLLEDLPVGLGDPELREALFDALEHKIAPPLEGDDPQALQTEPLTLGYAVRR